MGKTLGQRYDELIERVSAAEIAVEYGVGGDKVRRDLEYLHKELHRVEDQLAMYGRDYDPSNPPPMGRGKRDISFV